MMTLKERSEGQQNCKRIYVGYLVLQCYTYIQETSEGYQTYYSSSFGSHTKFPVSLVFVQVSHWTEKTSWHCVCQSTKVFIPLKKRYLVLLFHQKKFIFRFTWLSITLGGLGSWFEYITGCSVLSFAVIGHWICL